MSTGWDTIIGHEWAVQLLRGAMAHDRVGHAYLLTGPAQVGKTTLARTFAQALNCDAAAPEARPCGACRHCRLIAAAHRHPDVRLLAPEVSGRGELTLKIEQVRELQQGLSLAAYEARTKVAILPRFDGATIGAANAFLKTLEEPPASVVLLLTAIEADGLLPTIVSRCRTIGLRPLPLDLVERSLATRWGVPARDAELLAHLADGRLGWAVTASEDESLLAARATQLAHLTDALAGDRVARFALADKLARRPEAVPEMLRQWLSWWRDVLLLAQGPGANGRLPSVTNLDHATTLHDRAETWPADAILTSLSETHLSLRRLAQNGNTRLVLENLLLQYPTAS